MKDNILIVIVALVFAIVSSWIPFLMYELTASVFTILGEAAWKQTTFFMWIAFATWFLWMENR